ncbi:hypothetical protein C6C11_12035 [Aeromonas hydrophila]|uniref:Uncharacterized protein n=1 Tax=Aeromonas hydrophila TaxID=644 RepID=A0ABD7G7T6_AERHY|nr:hypothetical protein C6C11_12035 [Aeromonas hydrophila]
MKRVLPVFPGRAGRAKKSALSPGILRHWLASAKEGILAWTMGADEIKGFLSVAMREKRLRMPGQIAIMCSLNSSFSDVG